MIVGGLALLLAAAVAGPGQGEVYHVLSGYRLLEAGECGPAAAAFAVALYHRESPAIRAALIDSHCRCHNPSGAARAAAPVAGGWLGARSLAGLLSPLAGPFGRLPGWAGPFLPLRRRGCLR